MTRKRSNDPAHAYRYQSLIEERLTDLSTAEQVVASHLFSHPDQLPFETAGSLSKRLGVSAMTVGRTLKALGYRGLADLRSEMRSEVSDAAPWGNRRTSKSPPALASLERTNALRRELEAIEAVHALAETPVWQDTVKLIADADQVFVCGLQTERGIGITFADLLAFVRPGVRLLSINDRAFADLRTEGGSDSCIVMIDSRRYSRWFRQLGEKAISLGVPLVIVTDAYCTWAKSLTSRVLHARTDSGRFWDNNAPILSVLNLMIEDVIERLGDAVFSQLDASSEFGAAFVGFDRVHRRRQSGAVRSARAIEAPRGAQKRRRKRAR